MELNILPVEHFDKMMKITKILLRPLAWSVFYRPVYIVSKIVYILASKKGIDIKLGLRIFLKKSNWLPLFWIGHMTDIHFKD